MSTISPPPPRQQINVQAYPWFPASYTHTLLTFTVTHTHAHTHARSHTSQLPYVSTTTDDTGHRHNAITHISADECTSENTQTHTHTHFSATADRQTTFRNSTQATTESGIVHQIICRVHRNVVHMHGVVCVPVISFLCVS